MRSAWKLVGMASLYPPACLGQDQPDLGEHGRARPGGTVVAQPIEPAPRAQRLKDLAPEGLVCDLRLHQRTNLLQDRDPLREAFVEELFQPLTGRTSQRRRSASRADREQKVATTDDGGQREVALG